MIHGYYNERLYTIYSDGEEVYQAGNSKLDSQVYLDPEHPGSLSLETMRQFCEQTAEELAEERGEALGACSYCDDE